MRHMMPIGRRRDMSPFGGWDVDRLFDDFFKRPFALRILAKEQMPAVDVYEKNGGVMVKAELPGIKPEDVELSIDDNLLTIRGEKKQENEVKEKDYYHVERSYGSFQRVVELPSSVQAEKAKASYKDGVLQVELPKAKVQKKKKIEIEKQ